MEGSATFTTDTSRTTMRYATASTASARQRRGSGALIWLVTPCSP
jgi:hypothetical protein